MINCNHRKLNLCSNCTGFTLVELMVALAMSAILIVAIYSAYIIQQRSHYTQSQVIEAQQNIRAAIEMVSRDIRMALYDPGGDAKADIPVATSSTLQIRMDLNNNGDYADADEDVTYTLSDDSGNGVSTSGRGTLNRNGISVAENIHAIEFYYRSVDDAFSATTTPTATNREEIQSVQISILAVTEQRDAKYTNNLVYTPASGVAWPSQPFGDNFRRRLLTQTINIRNQGL